MLSSTEMVIVALVIMLLFGSSQLPKMAKNLGIAQRELKDALAGNDDETAAETAKATKSATLDA